MSEELSAAAPEAPVNDGPITVDDYVSEKRAAREAAASEPETPEVVETPAVDEPVAEETVVEVEAEEEIETPVDDTEEEIQDNQPEEVKEVEEDGEGEPLPAPHFWSAESKEHFASLDPQTQAIVLEQDKHAQAAVSRAQNEALTKGRELQAQTQSYQVKQTQLDSTIELAEAYVATNLNFDDSQLADAVLSGSITPEQGQQLRLERDAHMQKLETLKGQVQQIKEQDYQSFVHDEFAKLSELSPELHQNQEARTELASFLVESGYTPESLKMISANDMALAYDAMRYRKGQQKLAKAPKKKAVPPKRVTKPSRKSVNHQSKVKAAKSRYDKSGSMDDYRSYMKAKREAA